jgi:signal transduction histidine kinase/ActR/RegA family two-component response regulator
MDVWRKEMIPDAVCAHLDRFIPPFEAQKRAGEGQEPECDEMNAIEDKVQRQAHLLRHRYLVLCIFLMLGIGLNNLAMGVAADGMRGLLKWDNAPRIWFVWLLSRYLKQLPLGNVSPSEAAQTLAFYSLYRFLLSVVSSFELAWLYVPLMGCNTALPILLSDIGGTALSPTVKSGLLVLYLTLVLGSLQSVWGTSVTIHVNWSMAPSLIVQFTSIVPCGYFLYIAEQGKRLLVSELRNLVDIARSASSAKTTFISNITHDLRTPIHAILGFITLIEESQLTSLQQAYITSIKSSCYNLTSVINNVLDFALIEKDKMEFTKANVDLHTLVQNVSDSISSLAEEKDLNFDIDLSFPPSKRFVVSDEKALCRVLTNLLGNAVKFTDKGHIKLKVKHLHADTFVFEVEDTGRGMTETFLRKKLFNPFSQENRLLNAEGREGTGLGLSLSQRIVKKLGSEIQVESELHRGTRFFFTLALKQCGQAECMSPSGSVREVVPFNIRAFVVADGETDALLLQMIQTELAQWDGLFGTPELGLSDQASSGLDRSDGTRRVVFVLNTSRCSDKDATSRFVEKVSQQVQQDSRSGVTCYIVLTRARRETFLVQNDIMEVTERTPVSKTEAVILPATPVKLHRALSSCVSHMKSISSQAKPATIPLPNTPVQEVDLCQIHVLVAEDNPIIASVISSLLTRRSIPFTLAHNGKIALDAWKANPAKYHAILMDIQMPVMDGFSACKAIRDAEKSNPPFKHKVKIIFTSANASIEEIAHAKAIGSDHYLTKPIEFNVLLKTLKEVLSLD